MNENQPALLDVVSGREAFKINITLDVTTIIYIALGVFVVGIALIAISKNWPAKR